MPSVKFKCSLHFHKIVQPVTIASQFDPVHTLQIHFLKIHFDNLLSLLRFRLQNALLSPFVPNENVRAQRLCRLSLTYYTLSPSQTR